MKLMAIMISKTPLLHKYQKCWKKQEFWPLKRVPSLGGGANLIITQRLLISACVCRRPELPFGWVFGVQLDYSCRLKSVPSDGINRVEGGS